MRRLAFVALNVVVASLFAGCAFSHERGRASVEGPDSETHFLQACDPECGQGLACICGVCTMVCESSDDCGPLSGEARCVSIDEFGNARQCGPDDPGDQAVCEVECREDIDCKPLGDGFACRAGFCRESSATVPDSGVSDVDAGDAGPDAGSDEPGPEVPHRTCVEECDRGADGTVDSRIVSTYDADDNLVRTETDSDGDGNTNEIVVYDSAGKVLRSEHDGDNDGKLEQLQVYTYDSNGEQLSREGFFDGDGDGVTERYESYAISYTEDGEVLRDEAFEYDNGWVAVDCTESRHTTTREGSVETITEEFDDGCDGTVDEVTVFIRTYDAAGNLMRDVADGDGDAFPGRVMTYAYNENGNEVRLEVDHDGDGSPDRVTVYTYDEAGNRIRMEVEDSVPGNESGYLEVYDENGNTVLREDDRDGDGIVDTRTTTEWDENGNETWAHSYSSYEFFWDYEQAFTYDDEGRRLEVAYDFGSDGVVDYRTTYTHECSE